MLINREGGFINQSISGLTGKESFVLITGVFLVSLSLLAYEVVLIRLLSVMLTYHYVFAVVSTALFGLGIGSVFVYLFSPGPAGGSGRFGSLAVDAGLYSLSLALPSMLAIKLGHVSSLLNNVLVFFSLLVIPFFFGGVFLAGVFRMYPADSARIYGVDLVGSAAGCVAVVYALDSLGARNAILLLSVIASAAAVMLAAAGKMRGAGRVIIPAACFLVASALFGAGLGTSLLPDIAMGTNREKEIYDALHGFRGRIIETDQSAFGRIDLIEYGDQQDWMDLYLDGTAGMPMYRFGGDPENPGAGVEGLKTGFPGYFPFLFLEEGERDSALVIGPGGGRDILLALMGGVRKVTAVEVNKDLVDMVRDYSWYNGGIYQGLENVEVVVGEGRNFLKGSRDKFDIIMFSLPVTNTSRSPEGYALTESFLFTAEAINDYLDHLTEEGRLIAVTHNDFEVLRMLSITLAALEKRGTGNADAMKQVYLAGSEDYPVFVLKKVPFRPEEALAAYRAAVGRSGYSPLSSYFPHVMQAGKINPVLASLETGHRSLGDLVGMVGKLGYDISPVTDESPFFYKLENGIPRPVFLVFLASAALMLPVVLGPPLAYRRKRGRLHDKKSPEKPAVFGLIVVFSMLGIGFMLVEVSLIQRFMLFLGQPLLSTTATLFSLLVGAGLGSLWSNRLAPANTIRGVICAALIIAVMLLSYNFILPLLLNRMLALGLWVRLSAAVALLLPLGFIMGFPFPLAFRWLKEMGMESFIPWMLGINGIGSVLGSALTVLIAIRSGFTAALLLGSACYFTVFIAAHRLRSRMR